MNDAISRKAAIDAIYNCTNIFIGNLPVMVEKTEAYKALAALPPAQPEWIPCSERLPEEKINPNTQDYDWVLCSTTFGDVRAYHFGRGRFLHGCGDVTQYVIAWMWMPEPYRGEGEQK